MTQNATGYIGQHGGSSASVLAETRNWGVINPIFLCISE